MASRHSSRRNSVAQGALAASSRRNSAQSPSSPRGDAHTIVPALQNLSVQAAGPTAQEPPRRKGLGTLGDRILALTNHFAVDLSKMTNLFEYTLAVTKEGAAVKGGGLNRRIVQLLLNNDKMKRAATDYQTKLISIDELTPSDRSSYVYTVNYYEEEENGPRSGDDRVLYDILVERSQILPIDPFRRYLAAQNHSFNRITEYLTAINLILSRFPNQTPNMTTAARGTKYFDISPQNGRVDLDFGLEAYKGSFRSARASRGGLILNVNTTAGAFLKEGRLDLIMDELEPRHQSGPFESRLDELENHLKHIRVRLRYGKGRARTILRIPRLATQGIAPTGETWSFTRGVNPEFPHLQTGIRVTVNRHFQEAYPSVQRFDLKSLVVDIGTVQQPVVVPADLLYLLPGQAYRGFLPHSEQTTNMINFACRRPTENIALILNESLPQLGVGRSSGPQNQFNIRIKNELMRIPARSLPSPKVWFKGDRIDRAAATGDWNLQNRRLPSSPDQSMVKYALLELRLPEQQSATNLDSFVEEINRGISTYMSLPGVRFQTFPDVSATMSWPSQNPRENFNTFFNRLKSRDIRVLFVILPNHSAQNYEDIKAAADVFCGLHTICTVRKGSRVKASVGEVANLILKLNLKLGGQNIRMKTDEAHNVLKKRTMFVGADVSHPSPGSMKEAPSIAGVVATIDQQYSQYLGGVRLQRHQNEVKQALEMIANFDDLIEERLNVYAKFNNGQLPEQIIIYRDGVSDGQYALVNTEELPLIRRGCDRVYGDLPRPKILLLTVQKRHHVRFYNPAQTASRHFDANRNPLPGFVVDAQITSERYWDWYCVSHKCLQGTSRPAKYVVLHDSIGVSADEIQLLTHHMCWLFGRATKSISVHPAARYADMICQRARLYLRPVFAPEPSPRDEVYSPSGPYWPGTVHRDLRDTMFFV